MSRGRKAKITPEKYLNAVKKTRSMSDTVIGKYLGIDRSNVNRFKNTNPVVVQNAQTIINSFQVSRFDAKNLTYEMYLRIPFIQEWKYKQIKNDVGELTMNDRLRVMYNVCRHLNTHPESLTIDQCSDLIVQSKAAYKKGLKFKRGLSYLATRKKMRNFFQLMHGISGELLTSYGIDAAKSQGTGSHSTQKVPKITRQKFLEILPLAVDEICERDFYSDYSTVDALIEMKGITYFMYYTATRIGAHNSNEQGTLSVITNNSKHILNPNEWRFNLWDKGRGRGIEWDKRLIDDGIDKMREYISTRFEIQPNNIEYELNEIDSYLFPMMNNDYDFERKIMKLALSKVGVNTKIPNHIWRHTFAQDFLPASDWNYELCAAVGGWKDTRTLKMHYGKMSDDAVSRGLQRAMGFEPEDVTYELRF